jgi:hypothetical protein
MNFPNSVGPFREIVWVTQSQEGFPVESLASFLLLQSNTDLLLQSNTDDFPNRSRTKWQGPPRKIVAATRTEAAAYTLMSR